MPVVQQYWFGNNPTLQASFALVGGGVCEIYLEGGVATRCRHGVRHQWPVDAEVRVDHHLCNDDLELVEWAIRGRRLAADRYCRQLIKEMVRMPDPCEGVKA